MSIENTLERIAVALEKIAAGKYEPVQQSIPVAPVAPVEVKPAPVPEVKKPVEAVVTPIVPPAPIVAPAPTLVSAAPVSAPSTCPITDGKSLLDYVHAVYKQIGPAKGGEIQTVLNGLGCTAINEVRPDQYAALYAGIEALKG